MTHLFNAMSAFHHRDPGLVGLLASDPVYHKELELFYGLIVDGFTLLHSGLRMQHTLQVYFCPVH